jgi:phosphoribosylamine--glycine ligase
MSRVFAKDLMRLYRIPTAEYKVFTSYLHAEDYLRLKGIPIVIKADGAPETNGVFTAHTVEEAVEALRIIMKERAFGDLGKRVILEKSIEGEEISFVVFTDGKTIIPLEVSKNYKRIFDGDKGPNTEGVGAYSPVSFFTKKQESLIMEKITGPLLKALGSEGIQYKGVLSADVIIRNGNPYVFELNCSFGDPEIQAVLPRLKTDFMDIALAITDKRLSDMQNKIAWSQKASVCVVAFSRGYPGTYQEGFIISSLEKLKKMEDVVAFHSNTAYNNSDIVTSGGRVVSVTATGSNIKDARSKAYRAIEKIHFEGIHYRKDIGDKVQ